MTERGTEIGFGTTFIAKGIPKQKFVVIEVEGQGWLISSKILNSSIGKEYLYPADGPKGNSQDIQEIINQLSHDEVITLAEEGARQEGRELSQGERELLKEHRQKREQ